MIRYHKEVSCLFGSRLASNLRLLVSNDDGVHAEGIHVLAASLSSLGEVTIVAPDRNRSGASNSLTLSAPLRVQQLRPRVYSVTGTPTDCVHLALGGLLDFTPDIVVSGINDSANMGDDTLYSGTVAAAMEGRNLGLPAIAVSCVSQNHEPKHFASAAEAALRIVQRLIRDRLPKDTLLNVNVPDLPWSDIQGFAVTRLGNRHPSAPSIRQLDPRGHAMYWIGPAGGIADASEGTDFAAVEQARVSITPITVDLTRHPFLPTLSQWAQGL
jgi:5'-nucleotidase